MGVQSYPLRGITVPMTPGDQIKQRRIARGFSQEALADAAGTTQSTIDRIEKGQYKRMPSKLPQIAQLLGLRLRDLDFDAADAVVEQRPLLPGHDFPIYASAEGGPGEIIRSTEPVDWAPRPYPLERVRDAYGLLITGDSMWPEYQAGETALVDPHLPLIGDAVYIFYTERPDGEARATIKKLRKHTPELWHVSQWNPPAGGKTDFTLSRKEWGICHRVLGKYSRR